MDELDPDHYVNNNSDQLAYVIKHSNDQFVRSLCLAALVEYGNEGDVSEVRKQLEQVEKERS
ncbi:hypothetical protein [Halobellus rarus]|uniref:HEAT repeat domain-containing protein n=1 Tax=Halobellus rarus TaxID=1126237 RepID=A0ABD6CSK3_9EURY|nr:hypothetical protein [Halobellus rarus]